MTLKLLPLREQDIPSFAALYTEATAQWSLEQATSLCMSARPGGLPRQAWIEMMTRKTINYDDMYYLKVVDTDLPPKDGASDDGEIISGAISRFYKAKVKSVVETIRGEDEQEEEAPVDLVDLMRRQFTELRKKFFPSQAYLNLDTVVTHPDHRRRGAASMLVKGVIDEADRQGIVSVLQASEMGIECYRKVGFEFVSEVQIDLKPFGVDAVEVTRNMIYWLESSWSHV